MKLVCFHGLGQNQKSWEKVIAKSNLQDCSAYPDLYELIRDKPSDCRNLYESLWEYCDQLDDDLILCGLSLGAVLALNCSIDHPEKIKGLVLIAPQFRMPKALLKFQNAVFRLMPTSSFHSSGMDKKEMIRLCSSMAELDFTESLNCISCPVLVLCGSQDKANQKAAEKLSEILMNASYQKIENSGHEVNLDQPESLSAALGKFWEKIRIEDKG